MRIHDVSEVRALKRRELARARHEKSFADLRTQAKSAPPLRPFEIRREGRLAIVAEVPGNRPDSERIAEGFDRAGAAAIAAATDRAILGGGIEHFRTARKASKRPILRREFVVDPWQIWESRVLGADALELVARLLDQGELSEYAHMAEELGMAVLVAVADERDLERVISALARSGAAGERAMLAAPGAVVPKVPKARTIVAIGNLRTARDLEEAFHRGAHAALLSEELADAGDPAARLGELIASGVSSAVATPTPATENRGPLTGLWPLS